MTSTTPAPWETVDPALINPRAVRLVEAFKDALARMRDEHGLTFDDLNTVTTLLEQLRDATGVPLSLCAMPLFSEVFQGGGDGRLPMRDDEPGVPLIASGRVLDGHGNPLAGAELVEFQLYGAIAATKAVLPAMREAGAGTLLYTTGAGSVDPVPQVGNVNAAAAALRNWVLNLHKELADTGIQAAHIAIDVMIGDANAVVPGIPSAPAEQIAPVYWDLHTHRDDAERVFSV